MSLRVGRIAAATGLKRTSATKGVRSTVRPRYFSLDTYEMAPQLTGYLLVGRISFVLVIMIRYVPVSWGGSSG